jgi:hypothetical protein
MAAGACPARRLHQQVSLGIRPAMMHPIAHRTQQLFATFRRLRGSRLAQPAMPHIDQLTTEDTEEDILCSLDDKSLNPILQVKTMKVN